MTTSISNKKWYVVRAVSGQESKIKDHIKSEISRFGFDNQVEDLLVPTEKVIQIRNGKKINCVRRCPKRVERLTDERWHIALPTVNSVKSR